MHSPFLLLTTLALAGSVSLGGALPGNPVASPPSPAPTVSGTTSTSPAVPMAPSAKATASSTKPAAPKPAAPKPEATPATTPSKAATPPAPKVSAPAVPQESQASEPAQASDTAKQTPGSASMGKAGLNPPMDAQRRSQPELLAARGQEATVPEQPAGTQGLPLGLDVSSWQGTVNWSVVSNNGAKFGYIKATEGVAYKNPNYTSQYNGSKAAGLIRGAYHFALPNVSAGAAQAAFFVQNGGQWSADGATMPPVLDIEDNPYGAKCYGLSASQMATWIRDFTRTVKSLTNKQAMIYTSYYFWQDCVGNTTEFSQSNPLWLASYYTNSPRIPGGWPAYTIWQYANDYADAGQTVRATFPGDQNVFNGSLQQLRQLASSPDNQPLNPPVGATSITGKWGGDGKTYAGWFKDGLWCVQLPTSSRSCFRYGDPGDKPVAGDWNGDGRGGIGIVRNGYWWLVDDIRTLSITRVVEFGIGSDKPLVGDWNGSGRDSIGIWRKSSFQVAYNIARPTVDEMSIFGISTDTPLVGDWDGDGKAGIGVWRNGEWWLSNQVRNPRVSTMVWFGVGSDTPVSGDWDGNRTSTLGIVRNGSWQLTNSLSRLSVDAILP